MFDLSKRIYIKNPKVKDLIAALECVNPDSILTVDALDEFYIHITEDNNHVAIDLSDLGEEYYNYYKSNNKKFPKKLDKDTRKPFVKDDNILDKSECMELLQLVVDNVSNQFLLNHGFTQKEIDFIKGEYHV